MPGNPFPSMFCFLAPGRFKWYYSYLMHPFQRGWPYHSPLDSLTLNNWCAFLIFLQFGQVLLLRLWFHIQNYCKDIVNYYSPFSGRYVKIVFSIGCFMGFWGNYPVFKWCNVILNYQNTKPALIITVPLSSGLGTALPFISTSVYLNAYIRYATAAKKPILFLNELMPAPTP